MNQPEPESAIAQHLNDFPIQPQFAYPDTKSIFRLFFVLLFYQFLGGILAAILFVILNNWGFKGAILKSFVYLLASIFAMSATIRYAIKKSKKQQTLSSFHISFNGVPGWLVALLIINSIALVIGLEKVSDMIPMPASVQKFFEDVFTKDIFSLIGVIIAGPVLEEILCRGIILNGLLKNYSPRKAIVISGLFFGLMHMNPWQGIPAFFGGLFLGWIYYKTRSVIPGMIIHATNNVVVSLFLFFPKDKQSFSDLLGEPYYIILCVLSALIFICGCVIIHKKVPTVPNQPEVMLDQDDLQNPEPLME